jgi:protein O-mannosyl-transferase
VNRARNVKYLIAGAVALATFLVYLPALQNGFVEWDDGSYIVDNTHIRSFDMALLRWAFSSFSVSNWHPLTWISHALDHAVWGLNPLGHHLTNIILHALNTFLVVLLVIRLLEAVHDSRLTLHNSRFTLVAAGTTGLLFGLHPVHVESVAWVAERKDLLCALFFLLSIMAYVRYADDVSDKAQRAERIGPTPGARRFVFYTNKHYRASLGFFILALLSKPMAVTLPVVLLILDWHPFRRIQSLKIFQPVFVEKFLFIACSLISSVLTILAQRAGGALSSIDAVPLSARVLVGTNALIAYLWKLLWPFHLIPLYPYPKNIVTVEYLPASVLVIGITAVSMVFVKKRKLWLTAWGYYVVTLIPVLGIVQVGGQSMADRYTYLPSLGPFLMTGLAVAWVSGKVNSLNKSRPIIKAFSVFAGILVFVALSYLTIVQTGIWKNSYSLWSYVIEKEPERVPQAYFSLGIVFGEREQLDTAIAYYDKAIAMDPAYYKAYENRGYIFEKRGQLDKAIDDYNRAIAMKPTRYRPYYNRGFVFWKMGQFDMALADYDKALALNPTYYDAYNNRGVVLAQMGRLEKALADYERAIGLEPSRYEAYYNRGKLYRSAGSKDFAIADYRKACDLGYENGCRAFYQLTGGWSTRQQ